MPNPRTGNPLSEGERNITISWIELLALKKLAIVSGALAKMMKGEAAREQLALTSVLVDVIHRAEVAAALSPLGERTNTRGDT